MTSYRYKITRQEPCTIWVKRNWYYTRWRRWGCFDTPQQARHALNMLRNMGPGGSPPLSEEDARQVVLT